MEKDFGARIFGAVAADYAKYRLLYPVELFKYLASLSPPRSRALDVATGNGQAAIGLASFFERVDATDINSEQLKNARTAPNVFYHCESAETSILPSHSFDLISVAMAVHWFDFSKFYENIERLAKPGAILALFGYSSPDASFSNEIGAIITRYLSDPIEPYWSPQVRLLVDGYKKIPFPFTEIAAPPFLIENDFTIDSWLGLVSTWSAVKTYEAKVDLNLLVTLREELKPVWTGLERVSLPLILKVGRV